MPSIVAVSLSCRNFSLLRSVCYNRGTDLGGWHGLKHIFTFVFSCILAVALVAVACTPGSGVKDVPLEVKSVGRNPKVALAGFYSLQSPTPTPRIPSYRLPLDLAQASNTPTIESSFSLSAGQRALLINNGFVVIPRSGDDMVKPYHDLKVKGVPVFVTSDTLLHLYHIQFNEILKRIEEAEFFASLTDMSKAMMQHSAEASQTMSDPRLKEASRRNVAFFAVALKLLQTPTAGYDEAAARAEVETWNRQHPSERKEFTPVYKVDFEVPGYVQTEVGREMTSVEAHGGFGPSAIFNSADSTGPIYQEDYSQYVPRGHYTRSETLKRYFKAMMWYGRMAFFLKGGPDALVSEADADIATIQATLLSIGLPLTQAGAGTTQDVWDRIYSVTAFFVGTADDLTPWEYAGAVRQVFGAEFQANDLARDAKLLELKAELAKLRNPEIYGGSGIVEIQPPLTKDKLYKGLEATKGLRFMGQRFVPDSYMFQHLVVPEVGSYTGNGQPFTMKSTPGGAVRAMPRGLDVMAVLGSDRALAILKKEGDTAYERYDEELAKLRQEFAGFSQADWNRNLYWSWLYALRPLLDSLGPGYPTFMQSEAWQDKQLNTALASWAELRHDTILYAKQSYSMQTTSMPQQPRPVVGYVEPVPEFYARMLALTRMTRQGLAGLSALSKAEEIRLNKLEEVLVRLIEISDNELENRELTESDYEFIRSFGEQLDGIIAGVEEKGKETTMIADVHSDTNNPMEALEEGVGYVDMVIVAYQVPDGRIIIGAGPTLSYYEFKQPLGNRLTDEAWKDMLSQGKAPPRPGWTGSFYSGK